MVATIIASSENQDTSLAVAFEASLKENGWKPAGHLPFVYTRPADKPGDTEGIMASAKTDVEAAAFESEWKNVVYTVIVSEKQLELYTAKGM